MSYPTQQPHTREYNQKRAMDIIRIGHDTLDDEHKLLQQAVLGIYRFQSIPSNKLDGKVYQYEIENQEEYNLYEIVLTTAIGLFEPVINHSKQMLFKLEMGIPTDYDFDMPQSTQKISNDAPDAPDTRSIFQKIQGKPKRKRIITKEDPYQHGLELIDDTMKKMGRFQRFQEYQAYGVDLALTAKFDTMMAYLQLHRTRFKFEIAPTIIRVHKQYIEMVKTTEKQGAIQMAMKINDELFATRNDFPMPPK